MIDIEPISDRTKIDLELVPDRIMIDTSVFIRAVGERDDEHSKVCRGLIDAILRSDSPRFQILFPAIAVAEVMRKEGGESPMPRWKNFIVVPFDREAGKIVEKSLPSSVIKEQKMASGLSAPYLKYDALIVASAIRYKVDVLIGCDSDFRRLTKNTNVRFAKPEEFLKSQAELQYYSPSN